MRQNKSQVKVDAMWKTGTIALALLVLIVSWGRLAELSHIAYENITFRFEPTAERAFEYGERHFNAKDPQMYDIDRAERYFDQAAAKDPSIPYLYHELARISFLRGNYDQALARINFHIRLHPDTAPNAYYVRGLINGFKGDYTAAEKDFEHFLKTNPDSWAGINDYAWVLLKNDKPRERPESRRRGRRHVQEGGRGEYTHHRARYCLEYGRIKVIMTAYSRRGKVTSWKLIGNELGVAVALAAVAILIAGAASMNGERAAPISSEMRFTEASRGGLQIVPASCETSNPNPHYEGQCTPDYSACVSHSIPHTVYLGFSFSAAITFNNVGTNTWSAARGYDARHSPMPPGQPAMLPFQAPFPSG